MKNRSFKYLASFVVVSMCYVNTLLAQEGGFMFNDDGDQERVESPTSAPGSERSYHQPGGRPVVIRDNTTTATNKDEKKTTSHEATQKSTSEHSNTVKSEEPQSDKKEHTANPVIDTTNKEEDPDSILSFNFLHYMIQKFKFSDVLDQ